MSSGEPGQPGLPGSPGEPGVHFDISEGFL